MKVLIWVPARGGSQRIPGKNLKKVGGTTLLGRTVWLARSFLRAADLDARIIVDTDDDAIATEGRKWRAEVPFLREERWATNEAGSVETVVRLLQRLHELDGWRPDVVVALQPTSPLRRLDHVMQCWNPIARGADAAISLRSADVEISAAKALADDGLILPVAVEAQSPLYCPSGAFYGIRAEVLEQEGSFVPRGRTVGVVTRGVSALDVDEPHELELARGWAERSPSPSAGHCFVIAEAGVNHNGSKDLALELVDAAADAGADAVKFQTFDPALLVSREAPKAQYQTVQTGGNQSQKEMLDALVLPRAWHHDLQDHCRTRGISFMSTPFDEQSADFLRDLGVDCLKIPSGEITNWPFLDHVAGLGLPLIVSTGMANLQEVADAVERIQGGNVPDFSLLHCVSNYPAAPEHANLAAMDTLRALFEVPVGWSDHTLGIHISVAAAARGASIIEKHLTIDRTLPGPDHAASLEPLEMKRMVSCIRAVVSAVGDGEKVPVPSELPVAAVARRSLHVAQDVASGSVLQKDHLVALRPGTGLPPSMLDRVLGRTVATDLLRGALLAEDDLA